MNAANQRTEAQPVLRIVHDVDAGGHVLSVELEARANIAGDDAIAAWNAAHKRHPWIIGDKEATNREAVKRIALAQVRELLSATDEALYLLNRIESPSPAESGDQFRIGHASAVQQLRRSPEVDRLRSAAIDLRGYFFALQGKGAKRPEIPIYRHFKRCA